MSERFRSVKDEVNNVFSESNYIKIDDSQSRREETAEAKAELRAENMKCDRNNLMGKVGIHNTKTLDNYRSSCRQFFKFCRAEGHSKNHYTYKPEYVRDFVAYRLEAGCSYETIMSDLTAFNKLDDMLKASQLDRYGEIKYEPQNFSKVIAEIRSELKVEINTEHVNRAFKNPLNVIANLKSDEAKMCATLQLNYGLRVMNTSNIKLNSNNTLFVVSKAGYTVKEFKVSKEIYDKLKEFSGGKSTFQLIDYKKYLAEIKEACEKTGENYSGSHAFRYNFCQNLYNVCRAEGKTHDEARAICANALFHGRLDIVDRYLGIK